MNNENNSQMQYSVIKKKEEKYWLIPVLVFVTMIVSKIIQFVLVMFEFKSDFANTLFNMIFLICGFAVIPSIILAIVLSVKNNK